MLFNSRFQSKSGSVLIAGMIILGVMVFSATYLLSFTITGSKMSNSYELSAKSYYLAEAGISEAIFKLKNDPVWKNAFETLPTVPDPACSGWSIAPYTRTAALGPNNSYEITITNLGCAKAEIASLAKISAGGAVVAQKIVKVKVFKAMGNPISQYAICTSGSSENLDISAANPVHIHGGSLFANNILKVRDGSLLQVDNKALAKGNVIIASDSQIQGVVCGPNVCRTGCATSTDCPPAAVAAPPLNFNIGPDSYYQQATSSDCSSVRNDGKTYCLFSPEEFEKMMWLHYPQLSLPVGATVYVTGDVNVRAAQELTVNGALLADRDINLGSSLCWSRPEYPYLRCGFTRVTVVRPGNPENNLPSGLLAQRKINTSSWLGFGFSALNVQGLIYSGDETKLSSIAAPIVIHGGVVARKFTLTSLWQGTDIYLDSDVIVDTFKDPEYSPVITIDHWEEKY